MALNTTTYYYHYLCGFHLLLILSLLIICDTQVTWQTFSHLCDIDNHKTQRNSLCLPTYFKCYASKSKTELQAVMFFIGTIKQKQKLCALTTYILHLNIIRQISHQMRISKNKKKFLAIFCQFLYSFYCMEIRFFSLYMFVQLTYFRNNLCT